MKIDVDSRAFNEALREFRETTKRDLAEAIRYQAKLFVRDIIALMRPESGPKGRANVNRDIRRVFQEKYFGEGPRTLAKKAVNDRGFGKAFTDRMKNPKIRSRMETLIARGDTNALQKMLSNGIVKGRDGSTSDTVDASRHNAAKVRGVVPVGARGLSVVFTGKKSLLRAYIKAVQERVGRAKGGWGEAARALGVNLPAFVSRHASGRGSVTFVDTLMETSVTIVNRDPAAVQQDKQYNVSDRAHDMRVISMRTQVEKILAARAAKASAAK